MLNRRTILAMPLLATPALATPALAQTAWPERPTRWMVAYGAGGASDIFARMIARALATPGAPPIQVENRPSGGGIVATEAVLSGPADGTNLLHVDNGMMVYNPALYARLPFDPDRDLAMAAYLARFHFFVLVRPESPFQSLADLIAAGKREAVTYATPAVASPHHMCMELLRRRADFGATHVPYRGMPAVLTDLVAGRVDCAIADITNATPYLTSGRARALGTFGETRATAQPNVPTMAELGVPNAVAYGWQGVALPRAATPALLEAVNRGVQTAMATPEFSTQMRTLGAEVLPLTVAQCAALIAAESAIWRPLIREMGIRLEG